MRSRPAPVETAFADEVPVGAPVGPNEVETTKADRSGAYDEQRIDSCGEVSVGGRCVRWSVVWVVVRSVQPSLSCSFFASALASAASVLQRHSVSLPQIGPPSAGAD